MAQHGTFGAEAQVIGRVGDVLAWQAQFTGSLRFGPEPRIYLLPDTATPDDVRAVAEALNRRRIQPPQHT